MVIPVRLDFDQSDPTTPQAFTGPAALGAHDRSCGTGFHLLLGSLFVAAGSRHGPHLQ